MIQSINGNISQKECEGSEHIFGHRKKDTPKAKN